MKCGLVSQLNFDHKIWVTNFRRDPRNILNPSPSPQFQTNAQFPFQSVSKAHHGSFLVVKPFWHQFSCEPNDEQYYRHK